MTTRSSRDCKFKTFGCGAAVATSSMATELVKGKTIQEALQVTNKAVMEALDGLAAGEGTLFSAGRRGSTCCSMGLCGEKRHYHRRLKEAEERYPRG